MCQFNTSLWKPFAQEGEAQEYPIDCETPTVQADFVSSRDWYAFTQSSDIRVILIPSRFFLVAEAQPFVSKVP